MQRPRRNAARVATERNRQLAAAENDPAVENAALLADIQQTKHLAIVEKANDIVYGIQCCLRRRVRAKNMVSLACSWRVAIQLFPQMVWKFDKRNANGGRLEHKFDCSGEFGCRDELVSSLRQASDAFLSRFYVHTSVDLGDGDQRRLHPCSHVVYADERTPVRVSWVQKEISQTLPSMEEVCASAGFIKLSFYASTGSEEDTEESCIGVVGDEDEECDDAFDEVLLLRKSLHKIRDVCADFSQDNAKLRQDNKRLRRRVFGLVAQLAANGITVDDEKYLEQYKTEQKQSSGRSGKRKKQRRK